MSGQMRRSTRAALGIAMAVTLAACQVQTEPVLFHDLASAPRLQNSGDDNRPFVFRAATPDLNDYTALIIDPIAIYHGADRQFYDVAPEDQRIIADRMQQVFTAALQPHYAIRTAPDAHTARLTLTLAGIVKSVPVLSAVTHIMPTSLAMNAVLGAADAEGTFFGSITYAVEISDAASGALLCAYVRKAHPKATDIGSSIGYLDAAKTGVDKAAEDLAAKLANDCR